ncbi:hypothetical protein [Desulfopila aestuarii]|uniref:Uncharacterized protein n=1 Tax=Desulfopila aestuarii DSM 18488 TaxID=1121416 RepID=A0A1M7XXP7_9BACT|nr:hypothetical protein [Desulfopila aestuarii]SHO43719.1 hypothetical protein SAMN02745220_00485 [Desulfopila aestuarii DSM 18488]
MTNTIPPAQFGLPSRTVLEQIDESCVAIVVNRKSRIIMADGRNILAKASTIHTASPDVNVVLKTTAPVCSKTRRFLEESGIRVISG